MRLEKQLLTQNECYLRGESISPRGIVVHSTGANNPRLSRYVGPDDGLLGDNHYNNHWNQYRPSGLQVSAHAFIGKLMDGSIATYQTLPWEMRGWHAGGGANNTHIGFEICEDGLKDPHYFKLVYQEAVELSAFLCKEFNLTVNTIISHAEGYQYGVASNHSDPEHWFSRFGKCMGQFRKDVEEEISTMNQKEFNTLMNVYLEEMSNRPVSKWAKSGVSSSIDRGISDGSRPGSFATREEVILMLERQAKL